MRTQMARLKTNSNGAAPAQTWSEVRRKNGETTSSLRYRRQKIAACLGGLTGFICTVARQLLRRCTFDKFESLAAPLWIALRELMGFLMLASGCGQHLQKQ
jgi:hypothetical protein